MYFYKLVLLLPFILLLCSAQSTYYVTPTPETPCPGEPCLSFVEHTRQGGGHLENSTLVFLPGTHTIESSIEIGNLTSLTLLGDPSSLPQVTSRINCSQPASISFQYIENLFITTLSIVSCGSEGNDYHGAAVVAELVTNLTISNGLFQNNTNLNGFKGGALAVVFSSLTVSRTTFESNSASYGGGVYIRNSVANFNGNSFISNSGRINGGAVFVDSGLNSLSSLTSANFTENYFSHNGGGGVAIFADITVMLTFTENVFTNNSGSAVYGSFIQLPSTYYVTPTPDMPCPEKPCHTLSEYVQQAGQYLTVNTTFKFLPGNHYLRNRLLVSGIHSLTLEGDPRLPTRIVCSTTESTGFNFQHMRQLYISELIFDSCGGNYAASAALLLESIDYSEISNTIVKGTEFSLTEIDYRKTSALAVFDSTLLLSGSVFEDNFNAVGDGGGVYVQNSVVSITGSTFLNNSATSLLRRGGGVSLSHTTAHLMKNLFENNQANYGAGVSLTESVGSFTENIFISNVAIFGGGGAVIFNSTASFLNNTLVRNIAAGNGGAVSGELESSMEFSGNTFKDNSAMNGGGAAIQYSSTADFTDNDFINNSNSDTWEVEIDATSSATFANNNFINNTGYAVYGSTINSSSIYYVKPSPDTPCPESPCRTLSEYLRIADQYFTLNTTLVLLPGDHLLEGKLLVRDISALTLIGGTADGDSSRSLSTAASKIICTSGTVFFHFQNISEVNINSLGFVSCGNANFSAMSLLALLHVSISNCIVQNSTGGGLDVRGTGTLVLTHSSFIDNFSPIFGGGVHIVSVNNVIFTSDSFIGNLAGGSGGAIDILSSTATFEGNTVFLRNSVNGSGGAMFVGDSTVTFSGKTNFTTNSAQLFGGAIAIVNSTVSYHGDTIFVSNTAISGGGIEAKDSYVSFQQNIVFQNNSAINGGAIYAISSNLSTCEKSVFFTNSATYGGAVYAVQCRLNFEGENIFMKNSAFRDGGALLLTSDSKYYLLPDAITSFINNTAERTGGAITVDVSNQLVYCLETSLTSALNECFFQLNSKATIKYDRQLNDFNVRMDFNDNTAGEGGGDIYGGAVDNCGIQSIDKCCDFQSSGSVLDYITANSPETLDVSSDPLRICVCENNEANCNPSSITRQAYPGGKFIVSVIAFGQRNGRVSAVIEADLSQRNIRFDSLQYIQNTSSMCTDIEYTVFSLVEQTQEDIILHAQGPCPREGRSIELRLEVLQCPHGFELSTNRLACICSSRLEGFTDTCAIENGTILRPRDASFWVGYSNESGGLILHPQCPFDYCISEELYVSVDSSNLQCNYNRTGELCGECIQDLSVVLGSSRCLQCSDSHLTLLIAFAFAGIALVFFLFLLKLTVAVGTINGLIFYANVVQVNSALFFHSGTSNILTVFIAWINLDLGIETCFYDGMDAYAKTWLQFLFPIYVWTLVGIIILFSHFSQTISRLLGTNPIAVLCTLFLLSYAKVLRTIIAVLSVANLEYPDGRQAVWLLDGNIRYFKGGHVPLFLVALSALLFLFLPFNLLLFCGQWLRSKSDVRVFAWINKPAVKSFLDAYHAPYAAKHRYWTGLLLLTRFSLFLIFAFNALGDPDINLFCITAVTLAIVTIGFVAEKIYTNQYLAALEASFIINLGILAAATTSIAKGNQAALTYTSVSITFVTFIGIVVYHSHLQLKDSKLLKKIANLTLDTFHKRKKHNLNAKDADKPLVTIPTKSVVTLREPLLEDENY